MKLKTIGDFFNNLSLGEYLLCRGLSIAKGYAVLALFILSMSIVYAQPQSQCVIENNNQGSILECDVSFTTLFTEAGGVKAANAWNPDTSIKDAINEEFKQFAKVWCNATAANSWIREISVHTNGTNAEFWLLEEIGRSSAFAGYFPFTKPSAFIFNIDGTVLAHEFAHSALTIFDEYKETGRNISRSRIVAIR